MEVDMYERTERSLEAYSSSANQAASLRKAQRLPDSPSTEQLMPLKRAPEARAEAALGGQVRPARGRGEGPLDSPGHMVMTPCLLPQEEQSGNAGKAEGRRGGWLCCVGRRGSPGTEVEEGVGSRPTAGCVSNSTPPVPLGRRQEREAGQDASLRLFWPSLYLTMSVSECLSQPHKSNIPSGRCRAVIKQLAPGELDHHCLASNGCFPVKQAQVRPGRHS